MWSTQQRIKRKRYRINEEQRTKDKLTINSDNHYYFSHYTYIILSNNHKKLW